MKICMVSIYFYPAMVGGLEWYILNISRELGKLGVEVHVFTTDSMNGQKLPAKDVVEGVYVHRFPLYLDLSYRIKVWKGLQAELSNEHFDIIHVYDYAQYHSIVATKIAERLNAPTVLTVFDVHSMVPRPFFKQIPMLIYDKFFAKAVLNSVDRVLVRAPTLIPTLLKMGVKPDRIIVTPSGVSKEELIPSDGTLFREKFSLGFDPVILYLGRLHPMKGPQYLLMATPKVLKKFPTARIVLVGPDSGGFRKQLEVLASEIKISNNVIFTGPIYDLEEKKQAYAACNVFVMPSGYEGTSQSVFQAMAQGKPIVATAAGGLPYQVEVGREGYLIGYRDVDALASSIISLLSSENLAKFMGKNARKKAERFIYDYLALEIEKIYQTLVNR